ncbi:hypothetical protein QA633_39980 [Bradyrhizobium barranii]|uniref:hypothetical protein n=1 Tax=Bradyrhizobium barranii TaxID=2992140 RepID=UPI0024AEAB9D|nr:hypothetical protein [Bradyrhizobium barranii]WFT94374.1 hypothetical protein QA633_39980 [Bradyrhizobium barranii]
MSGDQIARHDLVINMGERELLESRDTIGCLQTEGLDKCRKVSVSHRPAEDDAESDRQSAPEIQSEYAAAVPSRLFRARSIATGPPNVIARQQIGDGLPVELFLEGVDPNLRSQDWT